MHQAYKIILITFIFFDHVHSGKLNEFVLRKSDDIFDGRNTLTQSVRKNGSGDSPQNAWHNEGFIGANATQITKSLGTTIDVSTNLLLATKSALLTTQLKDFSHTFLSIKFSSIIGHTEPVEDETNTLETSKKSPEILITTQAPILKAGVKPVAEPKQSVIITASIETPTEASTRQQNNVILSQSSQKNAGIVSFVDKIPSKPKPSHPPPPSSPKVQVEPRILKLDPEGSDGDQVIQISISPNAESQNSKKSKRSEEPGVSASKTIVVSYENMNSKTTEAQEEELEKISRRKRELDSEEITQIHKLLTLTKNLKGASKEIDKIKPKLKTIQEEIALEQDAQGADDLTKEEEARAQEGSSTKGKKLPYDVWKASVDKSARPPGFYVMVDEKVVFDNWFGVWQSSEPPSVMGRSSSPRRNEIWNDTVLLLQFDESPDRNIKISFEWEPADPTAYLFLSNITLSTYGANETLGSLGSSLTSIPQQSYMNGGNRNITLYIVVKPSEAAAAGPSKAFKEEEPDSSQPKRLQTQPTAPDGSVVNKAPVSNPKETSAKTPQGASTTGLITSAIIGVISIIILIFLIYKKIQLNRRRSSSSC